jgi:carbohydrate kinase (thermoresistant glucokinase family)
MKSMKILICGVCGSGKSTVGAQLQRALSAQLSTQFMDADSLHPINNIEKMKMGVALDDAERVGWLQDCHDWLWMDGDRILACSALKKQYRDLLAEAPDYSNVTLFLVHLHAPKQVLEERMSSRSHFMPVSLLEGQLSTWEPIQTTEKWFKVDFDVAVESTDSIVNSICEVFHSPS